jgi:hypothetical protein
MIFGSAFPSMPSGPASWPMEDWIRNNDVKVKYFKVGILVLVLVLIIIALATNGFNASGYVSGLVTAISVGVLLYVQYVQAKSVM